MNGMGDRLHHGQYRPGQHLRVAAAGRHAKQTGGRIVRREDDGVVRPQLASVGFPTLAQRDGRAAQDRHLLQLAAFALEEANQWPSGEMNGDRMPEMPVSSGASSWSRTERPTAFPSCRLALR